MCSVSVYVHACVCVCVYMYYVGVIEGGMGVVMHGGGGGGGGAQQIKCLNIENIPFIRDHTLKKKSDIPVHISSSDCKI